ncbi:GNAT family N-acetyltransferase [Frondihabitans sucicola]|uniref:GNAT family N-acetyltransferase n=1 Tax=Frondihabitans sucicola TaxID=1268041 RepID=UPI002573C00B|nr:GNAT family N-acetyltransferase [Frondihabitans sucicola]
MTHVLDDAIDGGLRGAHESLSLRSPSGAAVRYRPEIAPFASVGLEPSADAWAALRALVPDGTVALFPFPGFRTPPGGRVGGVGLAQLTDDEVDLEALPPAGRSRALSRDDVPEMLRLTAATKPGPFEVDTIEFGGYRGIFDGDELVAMAGRRMNPPGWTEISAVCTDPRYRGRGYARELVLDVLRGIRADGARGFLHVAHGNPARAVYESLGFVARRDFEVAVVRPAEPAEPDGSRPV